MVFRFTVRRLPVAEHPRDLMPSQRSGHIITSTAWWAWLEARWPRWSNAVRSKYRTRGLKPGDTVEVFGTGDVLVLDWNGRPGLERGRKAYDPSLPPGTILIARIEAVIDLADER